MRRSGLHVALTLAIGALAGCRPAESTAPTVLSAPADRLYAGVDPEARTVLPNGRFVRPLGRSVTVAPHPFGLVLSRTGDLAITANSGTDPLSISIIEGLGSANPTVRAIPPGPTTDEGVLASVFMGLAISPDGRTVYVAGGQENGIYLFDIRSGEKRGFIDCSIASERENYRFGYIGDMALSRDGTRLYAVDQMHFRLVIVDTVARRVVHSVPVGRYPFGVALSPDETKVYVANVGMFEYRKIPGTDEEDPETGLEYPAFGFGTPEMREGVEVEGRQVPGLGDPNDPESFSVWTVTLDPDGPRVTSKVKTGTLVGEPVEGIPAVGGSSPNSLVATSRRVFVSNGNNDAISVIDILARTPSWRTSSSILTRVWEGFLGGFPSASRSPRTRRALRGGGRHQRRGGGRHPRRLLGHIPVGWFPSKLAVTPDGETLIVANAKGFGSGPNGGPGFDRHAGELHRQPHERIRLGPPTSRPTPTCRRRPHRWWRTTSASTANSHLHPSGRQSDSALRGERPSPIKHLVFITKENRTYDEVFGQVEGGRGEPSLARYGSGVTFTNDGGTVTVVDAAIMPNHLALAELRHR